LLGIANGVISFEIALLEAIVGHHFDRAVDYCAFLQAAIGEFGDRQLKHSVVSVERVEECFDCAAFGDLVRRGRHQRIAWKAHLPADIAKSRFVFKTIKMNIANGWTVNTNCSNVDHWWIVSVRDCRRRTWIKLFPSVGNHFSVHPFVLLLVGFLLFQKIYDKSQTYCLKHYEQMDARLK
jgi:hypothetical protein